MKLTLLIFLSFPCLASTCFEKCQTTPRVGKTQCLKNCYPEIHSFCEKRFPTTDKQSASYDMAMNQCLTHAYPCQDKCTSRDKAKEKACREECLGN